jgi:lipopolysaccharide transport system ATP-binding protein
MSVSFRSLGVDAAEGAVIGVVGEEGAGHEALKREARNMHDVAVMDHSLARCDHLARARAIRELEAQRRMGATILFFSYEEQLLLSLCDEVWWLHEGKLAGRGDPREVYTAYLRHIAERIRAWGESNVPAISPKMRRGDGRAEVTSIELIGENGRETSVWRSGELAVVRVHVRFRGAAAGPVVGILIRTRIGLNVYGTNTELERLSLGPRAAGESLLVNFAFRCELCPGEYTLTAASHDPDGVWHDWLEDAVAFMVTDSRFTAGVANLRATVTLG